MRRIHAAKSGLAAWMSIQAALVLAETVSQDPADRLLRQERDRERLERLQQQTPEIAVPKKLEADRNLPPESIPDAEPTFLIEHADVKGNTVLPEAEIRNITAPFTGKRLGMNRINLLLRRLTQAFVDHGFITTRAYVGSQNLSSGTLEITVIPGKIERIEYNSRALEPGQDELPGVRLAFPAEPGETLRLADVEQGVDQLNRLRRNRAELQILPGQTPGGSVLSIRNRAADRFYYTLGADNYGQAANGENRFRAGIEANDLLGLQEAMSLNFIGSLDTNALLFAASVPAGYNTFSYTYAYSEFQSLIGEVALLFGQSSAHILAWNRVVGRSGRGKSSVDVSLTLREGTRDINNIELAPQNLSVLRLAYNQLRRFQMGETAGYWTVDAGYARGLKGFGANIDPADLPPEGAHAQFNKLDFSGSLGAQLTSALGYRGMLAAQWTRQALFSSEQVFAGGAGTVRGFAQSAFAGDRGFYTRHELIDARLPPIFERVRVEPFFLVDAAGVQLIADGKRQTIAGTGIGVRAASQHTNLELVLAKPVQYPETVTDTGWRIHATINLTL